MKAILLLILAFCLCASAVAGQRSPHDCCPDQHCSPQCIDMGCAPVALAIASTSLPVDWTAGGISVVRIFGSESDLPSPYRTIWLPPD